MFDCVADFVSYSFRKRFGADTYERCVRDVLHYLRFPALVWLGASGSTTDKTSTRICKFLGDISFPLYIIHYPFMYLFYAWLIKNEYFTLGETWEVAVCVCAWNVLLAYACLKLYDEPVRKWLSKKYLTKK